MATMHGPSRQDVVTLVVPQREQVQARVDDAAAAWVDVTLLASPRTSWAQLERSQVWIQFAGAQGLCRITGHLGHRPQDAGLRVIGFGAGETLRFSHRGFVQLLRRPSLIHARTNSRIVVLRADAPDHVAVQARCVAVGGEGLEVTGLPFASVGQHFDFDLHLVPQEAPVSGQFRIERIDADGTLHTRYTMLGSGHRGRIVHWAADHAGTRVA